jgi:hypothetical protein
MALYSVTLSRLVQAIKLAIGQEVDEALNPLANVVNEAINAFTVSHAWQWRNGALSLDVSADQQYVELPHDFGQLITLKYNSSGAGSGQMIAKPLSSIVALRAAGGSSAVSVPSYFYAVNWITQTSVTALPKARLELYPTPDATEVGVLIGYYKKITARLTANTDVPDMPAAYHTALMNFCCVYACEVFGVDPKRVPQLQQRKATLEAQMQALKNEDGLDQWDGLGRLHGLGSGEENFVEADPIILPPV